MFKKNTQKNAKMLGLSEAEYDEFLKRFKFYIASKIDENLTKKTIDNGFFILQDIIQKREKKKKDNLRYATRNPLILKYRDEIVSLYTDEKYGEKTIANMMKTNHKANISSDKIRYFLKKNDLLRGAKKMTKEEKDRKNFELFSL